jgi:peptidylprolyl isomerase
VTAAIAVAGTLLCLESGAGGAAASPAAAAPSDVAAPPPQAIHRPSGVAMMVLARGHGRERPRDNDCVKVHFTAWKRDGALLSDSRRQGQPLTQCLRATCPGVVEALKEMAVGERRRVWVPARLTHVGGDDEHSPLVDATFDLELFDIQRAPATPQRQPPRAARKLASGLAIQVLRRGSNARHPTTSDRVMLHFSGWTSDGRLIESSVMANHPAVFAMNAVIAGWREALATMVVGDKVRLWIPQALAYPRPRRGQPRGDLVYELELVAIL